MNRSKKSHAEHDREVRRVANEYLKKGYKFLADLPNQERPDTIKGLRPDLSVKKKGQETLVEMETTESAQSAREEKQKKAFKQWSGRNQQRHFRRIVTEK